MSASAGYSFRMGCGEPLQCRWWIARALQASVAARQERRNRTAGQIAAGRLNAGCRS